MSEGCEVRIFSPSGIVSQGFPAYPNILTTLLMRALGMQRPLGIFGAFLEFSGAFYWTFLFGCSPPHYIRFWPV